MGKKRKFRHSVDAEREGYRDRGRDGNDFTEKKKFRHQVVVSAKTEGQRDYIITAKNNDITFCTGPAGSGKTCVAVGLGLQAILAEVPSHSRLIILRPVKEAGGESESLGYLPGNLEEKLNPWLAPVADNMGVFIDKNQIKNLLYEKRVEIVPVSYCRGRSFNNCYIIYDESQNATKSSMKMILTRIGEGSKLIITGDLDQSDLKGDNGLADAVSRLQGIDGIGFVQMEATDIVRHPLIPKILGRYAMNGSFETVLQPLLSGSDKHSEGWVTSDGNGHGEQY